MRELPRNSGSVQTQPVLCYESTLTPGQARNSYKVGQMVPPFLVVVQPDQMVQGVSILEDRWPG